MLILILFFRLCQASLITERLHDLVQTACTIHLGKDDSRPMQFVLSRDGKPLQDPVTIDAAISVRPVLCRIRPSAPENSSTEGHRFALLSFATTASYLINTQRKNMQIRTALAIRNRWAIEYGIPNFLWLGILDSDYDETTVECKEKAQNTGHVIKVLSILALLERGDPGSERRSYDVVIYADMDTVPMRSDVELSAYLRLAPQASIVASSNPRQAILMNSGLMFIRNTPWSRAFLEGWWQRRCGFKDQLSLWAQLFSGWSRRLPALGAMPELFHNYSIARAETVKRLVHARNTSWPALREPGWPCLGRCGQFLQRYGCVIEPLWLPDVLLLPVASFTNEHGTLMPPIQGTGSYALFCHGACGNMSHLKEKPIGCARLIRQMRNDYSRHVRTNRQYQCRDCAPEEYPLDCARCGACEGHDEMTSCVKSWYKTKIFIIGWARTGQMSVRAGLENLRLFPSCSTDIVSAAANCKLITGSTKRLSWDLRSVLELRNAYPSAKFVLTTRDSSEVWNESISHWWASLTAEEQKSKYMTTLGSPGTEKYVQAYVQYNEDIRAVFAAENNGRFVEVVVDDDHSATMRNLCRFVDRSLMVTKYTRVAPRCLWPFPHKNANCRLHGHQKGRIFGAECSIL
mmetsp:Transcript_15432/g.23212  ORF Transcript_15432/g.23212 Transcript_15432/m.23212 type:complete len:631 (-) Transcript_15432:1285-3177(-)